MSHLFPIIGFALAAVAFFFVKVSRKKVRIYMQVNSGEITREKGEETYCKVKIGGDDRYDSGVIPVIFFEDGAEITLGGEGQCLADLYDGVIAALKQTFCLSHLFLLYIVADCHAGFLFEVRTQIRTAHMKFLRKTMRRYFSSRWEMVYCWTNRTTGESEDRSWSLDTCAV